jgi:CheY-like chemotaxis protein
MGSSPTAAQGTVVLLIDDEPHIHQAVRRLLGRIGVTLETATSGDLGIELIASRPDIRLVLLDFRLPERRGDEVLVDLKTRFPALPVAVVSASLDDALKQRLLAGGASACLDKDMIGTDLSALVGELLGL